MTEVDRLFEYIEFPKEIKVKFVAYKLKGKTSVWWDRLREIRMRKGHGLVQTWRIMKQLLQGRFCLRTMNNIFFMLVRDVHVVIGG